MPFTLPLGASLPDFCLASTAGEVLRAQDFQEASCLVIFFTCNHCPYVVGSDEITRKTAEKFMNKGVRFVGINSNDPSLYEEDSFYHMVERMKEKKFPWYYLFDPTQQVAKTFGALKTPHFYVFNNKKRLVYCGRAIDSPMDPKKIMVHDLETALQEILEGKKVSHPLTNPIGCTLKWKGHDAHWIPPEACDLVT